MRARAKSEDNIVVKSKLNEEVPFIDCGECPTCLITGGQETTAKPKDDLHRSGNISASEILQALNKAMD